MFPLLQLNTRKEGTFIMKGTLGNLVTKHLKEPLQEPYLVERLQHVWRLGAQWVYL